jgi:fibronectin-binding autotransporter adhesin
MQASPLVVLSPVEHKKACGGHLDGVESTVVTLQGDGSTTQATINCESENRVLQVDNSVLSFVNITFTKFSKKEGLEEGGAFLLTDSNVGFTSCSIIGGYTEEDRSEWSGATSGGGLAVYGGSVSLYDSEVQYTVASGGGGGGAVLYNNATLLMDDFSSLHHTDARLSADGKGGGVMCVGGCLVRGGAMRNVDADYGGALYAENGVVIIDGTTLATATASEDGGGIYAVDAHVFLQVGGWV